MQDPPESCQAFLDKEAARIALNEGDEDDAQGVITEDSPPTLGPSPVLAGCTCTWWKVEKVSLSSTPFTRLNASM